MCQEYQVKLIVHHKPTKPVTSFVKTVIIGMYHKSRIEPLAFQQNPKLRVTNTLLLWQKDF